MHAYSDNDEAPLAADGVSAPLDAERPRGL